MDSPNIPEHDDQELVNRLRADDQQAWKKVYNDNRLSVINYLRRRGSEPEIAEEIFHETLIILDQRKARLPLTAKLSTFLIGCARNLLYEHWKKKGKELTTFTDDFEKLDRQVLGDAEETSHLALLQLAFKDHTFLGDYNTEDLMQQALNRLSEKCRTLFRMRLNERLSDPQIAEILSMEYGRVRDQIYKCKEKLKVIFTELNKGNQ